MEKYNAYHALKRARTSTLRLGEATEPMSALEAAARSVRWLGQTNCQLFVGMSNQGQKFMDLSFSAEDAN